MNKQELAESMGDFVGPKISKYLEQRAGYTVSQSNAFFSPDGFFAVWDKLEEDKICVSLMHEGTFELIKWNPKRARHPLKTGTGRGPDRYIAFYSAIHEMITKKEKVLND